MKRITLADAAFVVAVTCVVVLTAVNGARLLGWPTRTPGTVSPPPAEPVRVGDWGEFLETGHRVGRADAPITIVQFTDYECPACRGWHLRFLPSLFHRFADSIAVVYRHWPLEYHHLAYPAARAVECAAAQGRFGEFQDELYARQGTPWFSRFAEVAKAVDVRDHDAFNACVSSALPVPSIDAGRELARRYRARGTPAFAVNGMFYSETPDSAGMDKIIVGLLAERARTGAKE